MDWSAEEIQGNPAYIVEFGSLDTLSAQSLSGSLDTLISILQPRLLTCVLSMIM